MHDVAKILCVFAACGLIFYIVMFIVGQPPSPDELVVHPDDYIAIQLNNIEPGAVQ